jgi:hypothetical protein
MALFADRNPSEPSDLSQYESSIFQTASTEGIDLVAKGTVAALEIRLELQRFLLRMATAGSIAIHQVVVNDALRRWHILRTIALTYQDAYFQQLNERYKYKLDSYRNLSESASELLFDTGVGIAYSPIHRPGIPTLGQAVGAQPASIWWASISWINAQGGESEAGPVVSIATENGSRLLVSPPIHPVNAVAWNVYAGETSDGLMKQNTNPLSLGETWTMPDEGLLSGVSPSKGQNPDTLLRRTATILRG